MTDEQLQERFKKLADKMVDDKDYLVSNETKSATGPYYDIFSKYTIKTWSTWGARGFSNLPKAMRQANVLWRMLNKK